MQDISDIYQKYADMVYRYLLSLTHDSGLAEELTQETFYQAIRSSGKYDGTCRVSTWLCAIAKNALRTYYRKNPQFEELPEGEGTYHATDCKGRQGMSAETQAIGNLERFELFRALHFLNDPFREVLYLRIFGELSFREIGEILGKSENWARVTFYRGKEKLRDRLKDTDNTDSAAGGRKDGNDHE